MPSSPHSTPSAGVREQLVEALRLNLVGPGPEQKDYDGELLPESPTRWYLSGFLAPSGAAVEDRTDPEVNDELDGAGAADDQSDEAVDRSPARRSPFPSSIGLTVFVPSGTAALEAEVYWGDYQPEERADTLTPGGHVSDDGPEDDAAPPLWRRTGRGEILELALPPGEEAAHCLVREEAGLRLDWSCRTVSDYLVERGVFEPGTRAVSVFLTNHRTPGESQHRDQAFIFQAELRLGLEAGFVGRSNPVGQSDLALAEEWDERLSDLHYRDCLDYAAGHGISSRVVRRAGDQVTQVATDWLPRAEVDRVEPRSLPEVELGMEALAELADGAAVERALRPLVALYEKWLMDQGETLATLNIRRRETATQLLDEAGVAAGRMHRGIDCLRDNPAALEAFRTANRCMAHAQRQRAAVRDGKRLDEVSAPLWRPFQLAFQLMCLPGVLDPTSEDRQIVDLLFFPTGGGKTEAYLGLAAFAMIWRRLQHPGRQGGGLSVLMRYTLRLLTLDQTERALALICALELERLAREDRGDKSLGEFPFELGLWVGLAASPNRLGYNGYKGPGQDDTAYLRWRRHEDDPHRHPSPVPLVRCPWCGHGLKKEGITLEPSPNLPTRLTVRCPNLECAWSGDEPLPLLVVDEEIYQRLPAFIIATLDKFAALPWQGRVGGLFGHVQRYDKDRYYGPAESGRGSPLPEGSLPPPDLIIQDELHLISGPLGTVAGLYETAVEALACRDTSAGRTVPKIIASTATARRSERQVRALFGRDTTAIFPPPGPARSDSFFAVTRPPGDTSARWYVGVAAQGRSLKRVLLHTATTLLSRAKTFLDTLPQPPQGYHPADPYLTLLGYFNTIRELGSSRHLVEEQLRAQVRQYDKHHREEPDERLFTSREINVEPLELTSRIATADVAKAKARLAEDYGGQQPVDVALATNMISVGLDIIRLGLMVVVGQPKSCAEYIQATSRVGRDPKRPGLVVVLLNQHKPRDRSHYERFVVWHQSFYREVEPSSVTPFAARALDRSLAAVLTSLCRQGEPLLNPEEGVAKIDRCADLDRLWAPLAARAETVADCADTVRQQCAELLATWQQLAAEADQHNEQLVYQRYEGSVTRDPPPLLRDPLESGLTAQEAQFRAHRSFRDVEPVIHLLEPKGD